MQSQHGSQESSELQQRIQTLEKQQKSEAESHQEMEKRQIRREVFYRNYIDQLNQTIKKQSSLSEPELQAINVIKETHDKLMSQIDQ